MPVDKGGPVNKGEPVEQGGPVDDGEVDDHELADRLIAAGVRRGSPLALVLAPGRSVALATEQETWIVASPSPAAFLRLVETALRPRWVWWSNDVATWLTGSNVRLSTCWDLSSVHRLLFGGWRAEPAVVWAALHDIADVPLPSMGQLGLLDAVGDEGVDPENPTRPDGHLRPEWASGAWAMTATRRRRWAALAMEAYALQQARIATLPHRNGAHSVARSESVTELLCAELAHHGLPVNIARAEQIIGTSVGPRPADERDVAVARERRDEDVLRHAPPGTGGDLRNPAHVRAMLTKIGIDVADTRAWRLEPFRGTHPLVEALLAWRKAERIATTYGYSWLDEHVGADGRLRGAWTACDGAAGRMTAQAGLHNLPAEMRDAVMAEPGHVFVHADLGQIEPRVLAAVSNDPVFAAAAREDDMYAPVAARLGVERPVAKIAVLAAMYGQTSGSAGETLRAMEVAFPVAMKFLRDADRLGQSGRNVRTYGGRLVRMGFRSADERNDRGVAAAKGRYARNAVVQGAAAELFKAWAVTVRARTASLDARIVLCLHDELLVHTPVGAAQEVRALLESALPEAASRWMPDSSVRYVAQARVIGKWSEAQK